MASSQVLVDLVCVECGRDLSDADHCTIEPSNGNAFCCCEGCTLIDVDEIALESAMGHNVPNDDPDDPSYES